MYAKCSRCINVPERPSIILLFYLAILYDLSSSSFSLPLLAIQEVPV